MGHDGMGWVGKGTGGMGGDRWGERGLCRGKGGGYLFHSILLRGIVISSAHLLPPFLTLY